MEYKKDFDGWNKKKKYLNERVLSESFFFLEREVWWASMGINIGHEIDGKNDYFERPVLILRKLTDNTLWVLQFSMTENTGNYFYKFIHNGKLRTISLSQIRFISSKRLLHLLSRIEEEEFIKIKDKVKEILDKGETP